MKRLVLIFLITVLGCDNQKKTSYKSIIAPIAKKVMVIELLSDNKKGRIAISPEIQGKVLTSTYNGLKGDSNGWINKEAIKGKELDIAEIGGEERLWFGPLGSQHSFYFQQLKPFDGENWLVPPSLSTEPYLLKKFISKEVLLSKQMTLTNFIGTEFNFEVLRKIRLLEQEEIERNLSIQIKRNVDYVAYESLNSIQNKDDKPWKKETGLVSVWNLNMFEGSDETVVIIPLINEASLDKIYKYLGPLDKSRLQLKKNSLLFKADGKYRTKIGVPHDMAPKIYGSYSRDKNRLTIIQYRKTIEKDYTNSDVSIQETPYKGEIIPIYNDGTMDYSPTTKTSFFELETTSASVELWPNKYVTHYHRVYHFSGEETELNTISEQLLGIRLEDCMLL